MTLKGPVAIGEFESHECLENSLQVAILKGKKRQIKKIINQGVPVDYTNSFGQTPLFCACYANHESIVDMLLAYGANPNERAIDGYTPVHAICYRCNTHVLTKLIGAGGDLRLHDQMGRTPKDWALLQNNEKKKQHMLQFLDKMRTFAITQSGKDLLMQKESFEKQNRSSSKSGTLLQLVKDRIGASNSSQQPFDESAINKPMCSMGFGTVYKDSVTSGIVSVLPIVPENELQHDKYGPTFNSGAFTVMESMTWGSTPVTVKRLHRQPTIGGDIDLLIQESDHIGHLRHGCILSLMGLCQTSNLDGMVLVYERVGKGSLYYYLHDMVEKLSFKQIFLIGIQVCEAMIYIHERGFIHASLTSHAVYLVNRSQAKIGNFEYMTPADSDERTFLSAENKYPNALSNWLAPEVLEQGTLSIASDMYSFCAVLWEMCEGIVPWDSYTDDFIKKKLIEENDCLPYKSSPCILKLFTTIMEHGFHKEPQYRTMSFRNVWTLLTARNSSKPEDSGSTSHGKHPVDSDRPPHGKHPVDSDRPPHSKHSVDSDSPSHGKQAVDSGRTSHSKHSSKERPSEHALEAEVTAAETHSHCKAGSKTPVTDKTNSAFDPSVCVKLQPDQTPWMFEIPVSQSPENEARCAEKPIHEQHRPDQQLDALEKRSRRVLTERDMNCAPSTTLYNSKHKNQDATLYTTLTNSPLRQRVMASSISSASPSSGSFRQQNSIKMSFIELSNDSGSKFKPAGHCTDSQEIDYSSKLSNAGSIYALFNQAHHRLQKANTSMDMTPEEVHRSFRCTEDVHVKENADSDEEQLIRQEFTAGEIAERYAKTEARYKHEWFGGHGGVRNLIDKYQQAADMSIDSEDMYDYGNSTPLQFPVTCMTTTSRGTCTSPAKHCYADVFPTAHMKMHSAACNTTSTSMSAAECGTQWENEDHILRILPAMISQIIPGKEDDQIEHRKQTTDISKCPDENDNTPEEFYFDDDILPDQKHLKLQGTSVKDRSYAQALAANATSLKIQSDYRGISEALSAAVGADLDMIDVYDGGYKATVTIKTSTPERSPHVNHIITHKQTNIATGQTETVYENVIITNALSTQK